MAQERQYVDVNVFVYWLTNHPKFGETSLGWIKKIESSQRGDYLTSSISLYEILVIIAGLTGKNLKDKTFTEEVIKTITQIKSLTIEPLEQKDFTFAIDLMRDYKLDYEDALHLSVATRTGSLSIISNDKHFSSTPIKAIF